MKTSSKKLFLFAFGIILGGVLMHPENARSQSAEAGIRTEIRGSVVHVYHTLQVPAGSGFNIYRSQAGSSFEKLNEEPVMAAADVSEFLGQLGEYAFLLQRAMEVETATSLFLRLRSSRMAASLASFYYPDAARALGRLYIDSTATAGSDATYRIELVDDRGTPTGATVEQQVSLAEVTAPKPAGLSAEHEGRQVTLKWKYPTSDEANDDKIVRFNIYNKLGENDFQLVNDEPIVRINNFTEFDYIFTVNTREASLNLVVAPVSLSMHEGPLSDEFAYTLLDQTPPGVITGLEALPGRNGEVELVWPVSPERDVTGYNIYSSDRIQGEFKKLNAELIPVLNTYFIDRPEKLQTSYFYRVTAVDEAGNESEMSNAAKADLEDHTPPAAPLSLEAVAQENGTVRLSWEEGPKKHNFRTYILLRQRLVPGAGKALSQVNSDDLNTNTYIDEGEAGNIFAEGAFYRYGIVAVDSARNFSDTLFTDVRIPDLTPPEAPVDLVAENKDGYSTLLRWNASISTDVGEYLVYKGETASELEHIKTLPAGDQTFKDDSVETAKTYYYAVSAKDTLGNEGLKTEIREVFVRDYTPPRAVRNVRATAEDNAVHITWEPVEVYDLAGYRIYVSDSPSGVYTLFRDALITENEYRTSSLDDNVWIQVRAVDTSGNESRKSEPANIYRPGE